MINFTFAKTSLLFVCFFSLTDRSFIFSFDEENELVAELIDFYYDLS